MCNLCSSTTNETPTGAYLTDVRSRPTFVARKNPSSAWDVGILWPDGETEVIKGFITEDAVKRITGHEYSQATPGNTNDKRPKRPRVS